MGIFREIISQSLSRAMFLFSMVLLVGIYLYGITFNWFRLILGEWSCLFCTNEVRVQVNTMFIL